MAKTTLSDKCMDFLILMRNLSELANSSGGLTIFARSYDVAGNRCEAGFSNRCTAQRQVCPKQLHNNGF